MTTGIFAVCSQRVVPLVGNRLAPFVAAIASGNLHRDVAEPAAGLCAVPVLHIRRYGHHHARRQGNGLLALLLIPALAVNADEYLPAAGGRVVDVPVVAAARLEGHVRKEHSLSAR